MTRLFTKALWIKARADNLHEARRCRKALTDPQGFYRYAPDDERVKAAVQVWVQKARNAHAIVMGRKPVIEKALVINNGDAVSGSLYAA